MQVWGIPGSTNWKVMGVTADRNMLLGIGDQS